MRITQQLRSIALSLEILPVFQAGKIANIIGDIATYFKTLLTDYSEEDHDIRLEVPSIAMLALYLRCPALDILDGLVEMEKRGAFYQVHDFYSPLRLGAPSQSGMRLQPAWLPI